MRFQRLGLAKFRKLANHAPQDRGNEHRRRRGNGREKNGFANIHGDFHAFIGFVMVATTVVIATATTTVTATTAIFAATTVVTATAVFVAATVVIATAVFVAVTVITATAVFVAMVFVAASAICACFVVFEMGIFRFAHGGLLLYRAGL